GRTNVFFLDEVQNISGWEKWVRRMYDDGFKFFITGSNAKLLSRELANN
ncbi:MAG: AAA family ATPase, partial [Elusimicrobiota bacterium]